MKMWEMCLLFLGRLSGRCYVQCMLGGLSAAGKSAVTFAVEEVSCIAVNLRWSLSGLWKGFPKHQGAANNVFVGGGEGPGDGAFQFNLALESLSPVRFHQGTRGGCS